MVRREVKMHIFRLLSSHSVLVCNMDGGNYWSYLY